MTSIQDRRQTLSLVDEAMSQGASETACAHALGLAQRTLRRWRAALKKDGQLKGDQRPHAIKPTPANALTEEERQKIIDTANAPRFASLPPSQIVPTLLDEGTYIASESSFYRVLKAHKMNRHRGKARAPRPTKPKETHVADRPNAVWAWDITWLPTTILGQFFKAYLILDVYSRKIVAWEVWEEENAEHSKEILRAACLSEGILASPSPLVLHGDNGAPLKALTVQALMHELGVTPSHSRPRVSNDNAFAEAMFRTLKYTPTLPEKGFCSLEEARQWFSSFCDWYNNHHKHSALRFVTPAEKHRGEDFEILAKRKELCEQAKQANPRRWIQNKTRNCTPVMQTYLNPTNTRQLERKLKKSA